MRDSWRQLTDHLTWPEVSRRELFRTAAVIAAGGALGSAFDLRSPQRAGAAESGVPVKTRATLYPSARVAAARANIQDYDWAREISDPVVARAEVVAAWTDDQLWTSVIGQGVPRSIAVNQALGSPTSGREIYDHGAYPWILDPDHPWKVIDPVTDEAFPTNDFAAYHTSGLNAQGVFDPDLADQSLLTNDSGNGRGPTWGVDDGTGWVDDDGNRWTFVAYWHHWALWYGGFSWIPQTRGTLFNGVQDLRDGYLYTGDLRYAHAGLILLDRVADVYPAMDIYPYRATCVNSDTGAKTGKVLGNIWEARLARDLVSAYDAFFPAIATTDDAAIVSYLSAKATAHGLPAKDSLDAIKYNIEENLVREVVRSVKRGQIYGNTGSHQATLATAAVVLDSSDPEETTAWIDFAFQPGGWDSSVAATGNSAAETVVTGGGLDPILVGTVDRDGFGSEAAPDYNIGWITDLRDLADALAGYDRCPDRDLYQHPRYRAMFRGLYALTMLNHWVTSGGQATGELAQHTPSIGDSGGPGRPRTLVAASECVHAFHVTGRVEQAQMAYALNGNSTDDLCSSIFDEDVAGVQEQIRALVAERGTLALGSQHLTGYGFAALRSGSGELARGAWLYHGRSGKYRHSDSAYHGHGDSLNLGLHALGVDMLPDLGYPEFNGDYAFRWEWNNATVSHNTVMVDRQTQLPHWDGTPLGFADTDRVRYVEVSSPEVFSPTTSVYRRAVLLVDIDEETSYVLDVFRVVGGDEHHLSFHTAGTEATVEGLSPVDQPTGTYAGAEVAQPDRSLVLDPDDESDWQLDGFRWLSNVSRHSDPVSGFSVDWPIPDTFGVHDPDPDLHLRWTLLSEVDDVTLCDGPVSATHELNPESLRYALAHREGSDLTSAFVSVIEPYSGQRSVTAIRPVPVRESGGEALSDQGAVAVVVELADGRTDYLVHTTRPDLPVVVDDRFGFQGAMGFLSLRDGEPEYACCHGAAGLAGLERLRGSAEVSGPVADFTTELSSSNELVLETATAGLDTEALAGGLVYATATTYRNAVFPIVGATATSTSRLTLDLGETSPVRGLVDADDPGQGHTYDIAAGGTATIPLTRVQSAGFGPEAHWMLADPSDSTVATDGSGNGHHATVTGGGLGSEGRVSGQTAWLCDGSTTEAETTCWLRTDQSFGVAAWVRPSATGSYRVIASQDGTTRSAFILQYDPAADRWSFSVPSVDVGTPTYPAARSANAPVLGAWVHLCGVYDAGVNELRLYVDGDLEGTATGVTAWHGTGPFRLGRSFSGSRFAGTISDLSVWATALPVLP